MKRKFMFLLAVFMIISLVLSACGANTAPAEAPAADAAAGEDTTANESGSDEAAGEEAVTEAVNGRYPKITIALGDDPVELTPLNYNQKADIAQLIYETLFDLENGVYVPRLAKGYTEVDELHWEVELYDYIYDSAGNNITADDVVYSYNYQTESGIFYKFDLFGSVEKIDDYKLLFTWTAPVDIVGGLEHPLCRTIIYSQAAMESGNFATNPVATGPYVVKEFVGGSKIVLEANDNYWQTDESLKSFRQQQNVQTIEYQVISEPAQHVIALESGAIDFSTIVPAENLAAFDDGGDFDAEFNVYPWYQGKQWVFVPNQSDGKFGSDINFRLAMFYAVDNESISQATGGTVIGSKAFGSLAFSDYNTAWEEQKTYINTFDPELAKEYLAKTDYDGEKLVFMASNDPETKNIATVVQAFLTNVGINNEITLVDGSELSNLQSDPTAFDMNINWIGGGDQIGSYNRILNNNEFGTGLSMGFVQDDTLQEMFETARTLSGHTVENMTALQNYIIDNAYLGHLGFAANNVVYSSDITNVVFRENTSLLPNACEYALP